MANSSSAAGFRHPRLAADPRPYWFRDGQVDRSRRVFAEALTDLASIGFTAVPADLPDGMSTEQYAGWLAGYGLAPTLTVFESALDETIDITDEMERAKRFAFDQLSLGVDRGLISSGAVLARLAAPGMGASFDEDRLTLAIENCGIVCHVLQSEGLRPLYRPQVGGVFETEREITRLLDTLGPEVVGFGPDIGHLCWCGVDPAALLSRYADRLAGIHLQDCFPDYLDPTAREGMGYPEILATQRLWAPPGSGVIDWPGVLAALPTHYSGDYVIRLDAQSSGSCAAAYQRSFEWARTSLPGVGA